MKFPEPVALAAAVRAIILAATAFGLHWSAEQIAAVMFAVEAVLALVTRASVTSTNAPQLQLGQSVNNGAAVVTSVVTQPAAAIVPPVEPAP